MEESLKSWFISWDNEFYSNYHELPSKFDDIPIPLLRLPKRLKQKEGKFLAVREDLIRIYAFNSNCNDAIDSFGLVEWLQSQSFRVSTVANPVDAAFLFFIDNTICPQRESFEIQIRQDKLILVASDCEGLIYGMDSLKILIAHFKGIGRNIELPLLAFGDSPKILQRAVVWSFQYQLVGFKENIGSYIKILSTFRINTLYLLLDKPFDFSEGAHDEINISDAIQSIRELFDLCQKCHIELVLSMTFDNRHINAEQFSSYFEVFRKCEVDNVLVISNVENSSESIQNNQLQVQGFRSIVDELIHIQTIKSVIFAFNQASRDSFSRELEDTPLIIQIYELNEIFPLQFSNKPVVLLKEYIDSIWQHVSDASLAEKSLVCFPICFEIDYITPQLPLMFALAMFGFISFVGERYLSVLEGAALEKLVAEISAIIIPSEEERQWQLQIKVIHHLFNYRANLLLNGSFTSGGGEVLPKQNTERLLYSLYFMADNMQFSDLPTREEAFNSYRMYRGVLLQCGFSLQSVRKKKLMSNVSRTSLIEDYINFINTLCVLSRAIFLARSISDQDETSVVASNLTLSNGVAVGDTNQTQQKRAAVYDNVDMTRRYEIKIHPKTEKITKLLINVVQQNILFRNFKSEEHTKIVEAFEFISGKAGEVIIRQGDSGEYFYIVESGKLDVYMESCGLRIKVGRTLGEGDYFGELALMYNTPRAATVISLETTNLWRIDRQTYRTIVTHHNKETSDEFFGLVSNVHILGKRLGDVLSHAELSKVVSTLEIEEFENGSVIIRQHQTGDYFYIISEGQVDVWQEKLVGNSGVGIGMNRNLMGTKLATLVRGDYFGEKALLADDVRQASCIAVGKVVCLSLSRDDFIAMIGSWQDITNVDHIQTAAKKAKIRESVYDSQYHISLHLDDIEQLNTLGVGAFGRVKVARHKSTAQLYALKAQSKAFIVSQNMQDMILNEMHIMKQIDHPFISKLHASVQDKKYIYFLLELLPGGEFFSFLQSAGKLSEDKSRFYSASVVLALEELHKSKIAYRDLKPENMVMDGRGYVKLVDFGLAKHIVSGSTWTMCGTPDYLAPEIILNKGHNHSVDYWALGVLIFEMMHGWPPFYHDQPMKVYEKIILGKVDFPSSFSKALEDIIAKFLVTNPSKRLGNMKGGIADIFKHKWFGSFDWQSLLAGTLLAPFIPDLSTFDSAVAAGADDEDYTEEPEDSDWEPLLL